MKIDLQCSVRQHNYNFSAFFSCSFKKYFIYLFLERGEGREKEGWEGLLCERETWIGCPLYALWPGTKPATHACALTGNWTSYLSLCGMMPKQLSHTSQGFMCILRCISIIVQWGVKGTSPHSWLDQTSDRGTDTTVWGLVVAYFPFCFFFSVSPEFC